MSKSRARRIEEQRRKITRWKKRRIVNSCDVTYDHKAFDITKAVMIPVNVEPGAEMLRCWHNVAAKVEREGGKIFVVV